MHRIVWRLALLWVMWKASKDAADKLPGKASKQADYSRAFAEVTTDLYFAARGQLADDVREEQIARDHGSRSAR